MTKKISQCQIEKDPTTAPKVNGNILHHREISVALGNCKNNQGEKVPRPSANLLDRTF
jgi:hypothetical protein